MKITSNSLCPCGSKIKYKKCCKIFHEGSNPKTALELMKSRYCAYVTSKFKYIIKTTHPLNEEYSNDILRWTKEIKDFSESSIFKGLEILDYQEGTNKSLKLIFLKIQKIFHLQKRVNS